jgi:type IX secretion system substrate protein
MWRESEEKSAKTSSCFVRFIKAVTAGSYFKSSLLMALFVASCFIAVSQNLVTNPGAELTPAGTAWTIVSSGANVCAAGSAAFTYSNWTMTPDGSANYPVAHGGTKTFYAGCNTTVPAGPFELNQTIDVSTSAAQIDGGFVSFSFNGYIQTPIAAQADAGRFIVDYLNASGTVLGTSYTSSYQSGTGGSGSSWIPYANTRAAASGTRKVRIRLQTTIATGPAINAYFDDISLTKLTALPIALVSFSGKQIADNINLNWSINDAMGFSRFEIEKSTDTASFVTIKSVDFINGQTGYSYSDAYTSGQASIFYRLKMIDMSGQYTYSPTLIFNIGPSMLFTISPNPASKRIDVTGLHNNGTLFIRNMNGGNMLQSRVNTSSLSLDISRLSKGIYLVSYSNGNALTTQKLIVQ